MYNTKMTKKEILKNYKNVICIGYCEISWLLKGRERNGYTCGVYGWNADIYKINNNTCIVTGYRPFGNISKNYKINKKYDFQAFKIWINKRWKVETKYRKINEIFQQYINEIIQEV